MGHIHIAPVLYPHWCLVEMLHVVRVIWWATYTLPQYCIHTGVLWRCCSLSVCFGGPHTHCPSFVSTLVFCGDVARCRCVLVGPRPIVSILYPHWCLVEMLHVLKLKSCPSNPAYSCVLESPNSQAFENSNLTPPLGLTILPVSEDSKIGLDVVDSITVTDTPLRNQCESHVCLSLTKFLKDRTTPEIYKQAFFLESTSKHENCVQILSTAPKSMNRLLPKQCHHVDQKIIVLFAQWSCKQSAQFALKHAYHSLVIS